MPATSSDSPVTIVLAGVGGFGQYYIRHLLESPVASGFVFAAGIDPCAANTPQFALLKERGIPVYASLDEFHARHAPADLALVATPLHTHAPLTIKALAHGSHVLCEKPAAPTIQEVREMIAARDKAGRNVFIGYQWSFSTQIQSLKADIASGRFGKPLCFKTLVLWPRNHHYYTGREWAARLRHPRTGQWILDSPAGNAAAHYLHNMFYLLGDTPSSSAFPVQVAAELYRANDIENYDTVAARALVENGCEVLFYASHATDPQLGEMGPVCCFEFDNATIHFAGLGNPFVAKFHNGEIREYPHDPLVEGRKVRHALETVRKGTGSVLCGLEAAAAHTLCVNGIQESMPEIQDFPESLIRQSGEGDERVVYAEGLHQILNHAFAAGMLPFEMNVPWAFAGREMDLREYQDFPSPLYSVSEPQAALSNGRLN